jgi:hypothetical protein
MDVGMPQAGTRSALELERTGGAVNNPEAGLMATTMSSPATIGKHSGNGTIKMPGSFVQIGTVLDGQGKENRDKTRLLGENLLYPDFVFFNGLGGPPKGTHGTEEMLFAGTAADQPVFIGGVEMAKDEPGRAGAEEFRLLVKRGIVR